MNAYRDTHPEGPAVNPLSAHIHCSPPRVCDTGVEMRLIATDCGVVSVEQLEFFDDDDAWLPGPSLSAPASKDLGAWFADPDAHTSERTRRSRRWEPTWADDELVFTFSNGVFTASTSDGVQTRFMTEFGVRDADRMSVWLLRHPAPVVAA